MFENIFSNGKKYSKKLLVGINYLYNSINIPRKGFFLGAVSYELDCNNRVSEFEPLLLYYVNVWTNS